MICLYVPLSLALFLPQHLEQNSLSSLLGAPAPRLALISVCAQQLQQQQQHTVSEPWLAVDVEMGGIMSYYRVIWVYHHDCVSCSAHFIRRDKLLKMFSDFLHLLLLCPQIDFGSWRWEEMINSFSSCRDFLGEVPVVSKVYKYLNIWYSICMYGTVLVLCSTPQSTVHL